MSLSDSCSDFIDGYREGRSGRDVLLEEFREAIRHYSGKPWDFPPEMIAYLREAADAAAKADRPDAWQALLVRAAAVDLECAAVRIFADGWFGPPLKWEDVQAPRTAMRSLDEPAWAGDLYDAIGELIRKPGMTLVLLLRSASAMMADAEKVKAAHAKAFEITRGMATFHLHYDYDADGRLETIRIEDRTTGEHVGDVWVEK